MKKPQCERRKCDHLIGCARWKIEAGRPTYSASDDSGFATIRQDGARTTHLEMGIAWHDILDLLFGTSNHDFNEVLQEALELLHLFEEPDPHVGSDLVIPGASSV